MIRKFLVCGKQQLYLQQQIIEGFSEIGKVIELQLPIRNFWDIEEDIKEVNYLLSAGESSSEIVTAYRKVLRSCAQYATKEDDRLWLYLHGSEKR
ncbi:hypothetical protein [Pseudobacteriovorax antillogorgiicola]|uniref:Uncharacterized protein n=1 Tax=Pseudobacteriovorax antillogorgiicola TaxID=1513793 RepID=A0A1Y6C591_9BACT|nr:hypothetical protein [Pseudobacteriovorax antillogorgiicola]TCS49449.1 hypothetical protein EDD56_115131 [Pseudobacteriovorax antillogorgiicola]SMF46481.1 hypothetical protein SAMN06296036_11454 [Pseudobacteriovorax antillogorgiicola]